MTTDLYAEALATFDRLFEEAAVAGEPDRTAMIIATAALDARPSARTVLLKAHDARGFVFYTHLDGRKGRELQANPHAALLFHWPRVREGVQVRIEGAVEIVADTEADAYFASRPRGSQLGAWASKQSETLESRETFEQRIAKAEHEFEGREVTASAALGRPAGETGKGRVLVRRRFPPARAPAVRTQSCGRMDYADAVSVTGALQPLVGPQRIVCLTEEPTEVLYALGEQHRIVGISGFTVRPAQARREKPKVSAFTSAKIGEILKLRPDFVIGFSDIQADIAAELIRNGVEVWISNHRGVDEILDYVRRLGALVGAADKANAYAGQLQRGLAAIAGEAALLPRRPKVYFEEWDEPMITGIRWVAELVRIAGGDDIFPERAAESLAKQRILENGDEVIRRAPDIILGSWCGKKFRPEKVAARPGWGAIPAVRDGELHEIKSPVILQPGPAALTEGVAEIARIIRDWAAKN
jgi:iron complex transport system substrate-binding protein